MVIKEILLLLVTYPEPTSTAAIQAAIRLAKELGAHVTAVAFAIEMRSPVGFYADPMHVGSIFAAERKKSEANAAELVAQFTKLATAEGIAHDQSIQHCTAADLRHQIVMRSRFADVVVVPASDSEDVGHLAEALIFESGRPVLLLPEKIERPIPTSFKRVAVAWDRSRAAARAITDSLPLLRLADNIRVFTVVDEKPAAQSVTGARLIGYLERHGLQATFDKVNLAGRSVGDAIETYVAEQAIDLLVMGGYGHSRMAEFILGGVTRSILAKPFGWTLLSH